MEKLEKYISAFIDGFITGIDPLGCAAGHITRKDIFVGYVADQYSIVDDSDDQPDSRKIRMDPDTKVPKKSTDQNNFPQVKSRGLDEIVFKAVGDVAGISSNVVTDGFPQLVIGGGVALSRYAHELRVRYFQM